MIKVQFNRKLDKYVLYFYNEILLRFKENCLFHLQQNEMNLLKLCEAKKTFLRKKCQKKKCDFGDLDHVCTTRILIW